MYSCIQEILGGLSKCLPTRLLITTEKSPDTDISFYTPVRRQTHTETQAGTHTHKSYVPHYVSTNGWQEEAALQTAQGRAEYTPCTVFCPQSPWQGTRTHNSLLNEHRPLNEVKMPDVLTCANVGMYRTAPVDFNVLIRECSRWSTRADAIADR